MTNGALHVARTGLDAQNARMQVIANNLANVNTVGYKANTTAFSTLLASTSGSGDALNSFCDATDAASTASAWVFLRAFVSANAVELVTSIRACSFD